jgi:hypothetical protein
MAELLRHRQTKEAATDMFDPKATAPHLDSTKLGSSRWLKSLPFCPRKQTSSGGLGMSEKGHNRTHARDKQHSQFLERLPSGMLPA